MCVRVCVCVCVGGGVSACTGLVRAGVATHHPPGCASHGWPKLFPGCNGLTLLLHSTAPWAPLQHELRRKLVKDVKYTVKILLWSLLRYQRAHLKEGVGPLVARVTDAVRRLELASSSLSMCRKVCECVSM